MATARRRRLSRPGRRTRHATTYIAVTALLAVLLLVLAPAPPPAAAAPSQTRVTITEITPVVTRSSGARSTAVVRGRVTNTGSAPLSTPGVSLVGGPADVDIATWAADTSPATGTTLDTARLRTLPPGGSAPFVLEAEAADLVPGRPWGAAPVSVQVMGGSDGSAVRTFLGIHRAKEYEQLRVLWGIPVTLPADRQLVGPVGERRTRAWGDAVGADSRVARLTAARPGPGEVWFLDPTLLETGPAPKDGTDDAEAEAEHATRTARAESIERHLDPAATVLLPGADADIAAAAASDDAARLVRPQVTASRERADELGARGDVAWPADDLLASERLSSYRALYGGEAPVVVVGSSAFPEGRPRTAPHATESGHRLLVADTALSDLAGSLRRPRDAVLARQRLVAETAAVLGEMPGTARTVLVLPPRDTRPDPAAYAALRSGAEDIPWLTPGRLGTAVQETKGADPVTIPATVDEAHRQVEPSAPAPVLTADRARRVDQDREDMTTHASVRSDGPRWSSTLGPALGQLTSARWRNSTWAWLQAEQRLRDEVTLSPSDLTVSSGDINFFADSGRLQITIANHTDVELQHLEVRLDPGSPILRVDGQPDPVTIGPGSRQTVTVQATALAAGNVPVDVDVVAPDGRVLTTPARLDARVRPTGSWIYWALGGAAALLLAAGAWRTVRRHE